MRNPTGANLDWLRHDPPHVRELRDPAEIARFLDRERSYAATAFGYLEPRYFPRTEWYVATGGSGTALLLKVRGMGGAMLYLQGDPIPLEAIIARIHPFRRSYLTFEPAHEDLVQELFVLRGVQRLERMEVTAGRFRDGTFDASALGPADVDAVNDLYATDSGAWISRRQLGEQIYFGIWDGHRLVSIAGTQMISRSNGLAVVANVLTHPDYRNRGYATRCVGAVTRELLRQVDTVLLNVAPENSSAIHVYEGLGYRAVSRLAEGWAFWRGRRWWERALAAMYGWLTRQDGLH